MTVSKKSSVDRIKIKGDLDREGLKQQVQSENAEALQNLDAYSQIQNMKIEQNFNFTDSIDQYRGIFKSMVLSKITEAHVAEFAKFLEAENGELRDVLAEIHVNSMLKQIKSEVSKRKSFYDKFMKESINQGMSVYYRFSTGPTGSYRVDFYPSQFNDAYNLQVDKENDPDKQKEDAEKVERKNQVEMLKKTPIGRIFVMMGYDKKGEDGRTGFDRIFDGTDFIGVFILGLFGYSNIPGIAEAYQGIKGAVPDRYQGKIEKWETKARSSKLANPELKAQKPVEGKEEGKEGTEVKKVSNAIFEGYVSGGQTPDGDFELSSDYTLGIGKRPNSVEVDLSGGGKVTMPAKAKYKIGEESYEVMEKDAPKTLSKSDAAKFEFVSVVAKGTKFEGKVKFVKQESAES